MIAVESLYGVPLIWNVIVQGAAVPIEGSHLIYIVVEKKMGVVGYGKVEVGMNIHRVAGHVQAEICLSKAHLSNINLPQCFFLCSVLRYRVAESHVHPSVLNLRKVNID